MNIGRYEVDIEVDAILLITLYIIILSTIGLIGGTILPNQLLYDISVNVLVIATIVMSITVAFIFWENAPYMPDIKDVITIRKR